MNYNNLFKSEPLRLGLTQALIVSSWRKADVRAGRSAHVIKGTADVRYGRLTDHPKPPLTPYVAMARWGQLKDLDGEAYGIGKRRPEEMGRADRVEAINSTSSVNKE